MVAVLYRREAYAEAVALFQHIQPDQVEPERYKELKKIVAVCRMKASVNVIARDCGETRPRSLERGGTWQWYCGCSLADLEGSRPTHFP